MVDDRNRRASFDGSQGVVCFDAVAAGRAGAARLLDARGVAASTLIPPKGLDLTGWSAHDPHWHTAEIACTRAGAGVPRCRMGRGVAAPAVRGCSLIASVEPETAGDDSIVSRRLPPRRRRTTRSAPATARRVDQPDDRGAASRCRWPRKIGSAHRRPRATRSRRSSTAIGVAADERQGAGVPGRVRSRYSALLADTRYLGHPERRSMPETARAN
jgi:hypothetical protein